MSDNGSIIVIDNGSHSIKGGICGEFEPQHCFPSHVARYNLDRTHTQLYAGDNISRSPKKSVLSKVLLDANNVDWNGLQKLYQYLVSDKLGIEEDSQNGNHLLSPSVDNKSKFLLTELPFASKKNRAKMTQMLFESFNANGVYFGVSTSLSLYAHGFTTGVVVESGYLNTYITPVFEGYMFPLFGRKLKYGGQTVDIFLQHLLKSRSKNPISVPFEHIEKMKHEHSYVAIDFFDEETAATHRSHNTSGENDGNESLQAKSTNTGRYLLPDGKKLKTVEINAERFQCTELMFQPKLASIEEMSLPYSVHQSITKCDQSLHKLLFGSIILAGGGSMIRGLQQRLLKDVTHLAPASVKVCVHASPQRKYAAWTGGSLLASQSQMKDIWITPQLYEEYGAESLDVRCF